MISIRKIVLILFTTGISFVAAGQEKDAHIPFVLLIDNEVPNPSYIKGIFLIKDSIGIVKDSIKFDYEVGELDMAKSDYDKFFSINQIYNVFIEFEEMDFNPDSVTTHTYQILIPNKHLNWEYPNGFINKKYFILKIFNKSNLENRSKYYFKKNEDYIHQLSIPAMSTLIPYLKKN